MATQRESVPWDELREALVEYVEKANASPQVVRVLSGWSCRIYVEATDVPEARFTLVVRSGRSDAVIDGADGEPDLVIRGHSMDLAEVFWGDVNPASTYMQGALTAQGQMHDVLRLDAMAMSVYMGQ